MYRMYITIGTNKVQLVGKRMGSKEGAYEEAFPNS